jgi:hypothetical protein
VVSPLDSCRSSPSAWGPGAALALSKLGHRFYRTEAWCRHLENFLKGGYQFRRQLANETLALLLRNPDDAHTQVVIIGLLDSNGAVILSGTYVRAGSGLISVALSMDRCNVRAQFTAGVSKPSLDYGLPMDRRERLPKVDRTCHYDRLTRWFQWQIHLQRRLSPEVLG